MTETFDQRHRVSQAKEIITARLDQGWSLLGLEGLWVEEDWVRPDLAYIFDGSPEGLGDAEAVAARLASWPHDESFEWRSSRCGDVRACVSAGRSERGMTGRSTGAAYPGAVSDDRSRPARVDDVHELALAMPHVTVEYGTGDNPVYQVGGKSFIFFRKPRPDAVDLGTGQRYADVIVFWVESEADKQALVQDKTSPFFTTGHFDGHPSVLLRASRIGELTRDELAEVIQDAWLSRASARRAAAWLSAHSPT